MLSYADMKMTVMKENILLKFPVNSRHGPINTGPHGKVPGSVRRQRERAFIMVSVGRNRQDSVCRLRIG